MAQKAGKKSSSVSSSSDSLSGEERKAVVAEDGSVAGNKGDCNLVAGCSASAVLGRRMGAEMCRPLIPTGIWTGVRGSCGSNANHKCRSVSAVNADINL